MFKFQVGIAGNSPPLEHLNSRVLHKSCTNNINFPSHLRNHHDESNFSTPVNQRLEPDIDININDSHSVTDVLIRSIESSSEENDNAPIIRIEPPSVVFSQVSIVFVLLGLDPFLSPFCFVNHLIYYSCSMHRWYVSYES